jgi:hypothetical protein
VAAAAAAAAELGGGARGVVGVREHLIALEHPGDRVDRPARDERLKAHENRE